MALPLDEVKVHFATTLKALRLKLEMTQVEVATAAHLTQSAVSRYETGEDLPELPALLKLATGLRTPLDQLVAGIDAAYDALVDSRRETPPVSAAVGSAHGVEPARPTDEDQAFDPEVADTLAVIKQGIVELVAFTERVTRGQAAMDRAERPHLHETPERRRRRDHRQRPLKKPPRAAKRR